MAVDSENKRRALLGLLPVPDGSISTGDRRQIIFLYPVDSIDVTALRNTKHSVTYNMSVFTPSTLLAAQVNNGSIARGARSIAYDTGTGTYSLIRSYQELWVGTTPGSFDAGRVRVKSITGTAASGTITVDENGIDWQDDYYLTIRHHYPPFKIDPRISGGVFYKSYDTAYSSQNSQPPPVCIAGPHQVGKLSGGSLTFDIDLSDSYPIAQGATVSSYAMTAYPSTGISAQSISSSTGIGSVTVTQDGEWWAVCSCTDSNGKTQERFLALKCDSTPYTNVELKSWSESWGQGIRVSLAAFGDVTRSDFPDEALVVLWYEQYYDDATAFASIFSVGTNVAFAGYIRQESSQDSFSDKGVHEVTFECSTIDSLLDVIPLDSVSLDTTSNPTKWYQYARWLTVGRGIHHLLKWHSSILELADVIGLTSNTSLVKTITFEKGTLRSMANTLSNDRGVFAQLSSDRLGRIHLATDSQMLNTAGRNALSTVFDITESDVSGPVNYVRNTEERAYTAQLSGFAFDGVKSTPYISIIPGYRESNVSYGLPGRRGTSNPNRTAQVLSSQTDSNEKLGRVYATENREIKEFRITFRGSGYLEVLTTIPTSGWYSMGIANSSLARQLSVNSIRLLCRSINLRPDSKTGDAIVDAVFEPEAQGPDGIQGNYPTGIPSSPPNPSPPKWQAPQVLPGLVTWSSLYYRDDNDTDWSQLLTSSYTHGCIDPWWKVKQQSVNPEDVIWFGVGAAGLIERTRTITGSAVDLTPVDNPANTWSDGTAPTISDLSAVQILGDYWVDGRFYVLYGWQNGSSQWRGWLWYSDDNCESGAYVNLYDGITLPTQVRPLWMAVNGTYLLVTIWEDDVSDTLRVLVFNPTDMSYVTEYSLGTATSTNVDDKDYIAYPATAIDDDTLWYVYGRMNAPQALANPEHIITTANAGSSWTSFENGWTTDYCAAFQVTIDTVSGRPHFAIQQS